MVRHSIDARTNEGVLFTIEVELDAPYPSDDETETWLCPLRLVLPTLVFEDEVVGGDSLQALCLAVATLRKGLEDFHDSGGTFLGFELESYGFGLGFDAE